MGASFFLVKGKGKGVGGGHVLVGEFDVVGLRVCVCVSGLSVMDL